jgi:uncharacterized protein (TIGR02246 family)
MTPDEQEIRQLVATWMAASKAGDTDAVLSLMTDDAVFLAAGRPIMRKDDFARASRAQAAGQAPQFDGHSDVQEVQVHGDWAFMWTNLTVVATPPDGGAKTTRTGHTLTILKKQGGKWHLARDANMLAPAQPK